MNGLLALLLQGLGFGDRANGETAFEFLRQPLTAVNRLDYMDFRRTVLGVFVFVPCWSPSCQFPGSNFDVVAAPENQIEDIQKIIAQPRIFSLSRPTRRHQPLRGSDRLTAWLDNLNDLPINADGSDSMALQRSFLKKTLCLGHGRPNKMIHTHATEHRK